jgi:hypothetical protein
LPFSSMSSCFPVAAGVSTMASTRPRRSLRHDSGFWSAAAIP